MPPPVQLPGSQPGAPPPAPIEAGCARTALTAIHAAQAALRHDLHCHTVAHMLRTSSSGEDEDEAAGHHQPSCQEVNLVGLVREGEEVCGLAYQRGKVCKRAGR